MASRQPKVKVAQRWDGYDANVYAVLQTVNTTTPTINAKLTKEQVDDLILSGVDVTIVPDK